MSFISLLKHECTIRRSTVTRTLGVDKKTWADSSTAVPCSVQERTGKTESTRVGEYHEYTAVGYFLSNADLKPRGGDDQKDVIKLTAPAAVANTYYQVLHVGDESGRGHHLTAYLKRVPSP